MPTPEREYQLFLPEGFTQQATTVVEALKQAKGVLLDEHRWNQGHWFENPEPEVDPDNAYCNSWTACAMGAVGVVTVGCFREVEYVDEENKPVWTQWQFDEIEADDNNLYVRANEVLQSVLPNMFTGVWSDELQDWVTEREGDSYDEIPAFNDDDGTTYVEVIAAFDRAIAKAEELVEVS